MRFDFITIKNKIHYVWLGVIFSHFESGRVLLPTYVLDIDGKAAHKFCKMQSIMKKLLSIDIIP